MKKKILAGVLAVLFVFSAALLGACSGSDSNKSYTLNEFLSASPLNWNPHSWETNADNYFAGYCEMGFVDVTIAADGVNFEWVYEMATAVDDITKDFADKEKWLIPADADKEYVYKITETSCTMDVAGEGTVTRDTTIYTVTIKVTDDTKKHPGVLDVEVIDVKAEDEDGNVLDFDLSDLDISPDGDR